MADNRYEFRYKAGDVSSAQRMRMLRSKQIKVLPGLFPATPIASWGLVLEIALIYLATLVVMMLVTPYLDFLFNRFWRLPLQYQFNDRQMRLSVVKGKSKGLRLEWKDIQRIEENPRVFILYYGAGGKFLILPKSIFDERGMQRFVGILGRFNRPTPPGASQQGAAAVSEPEAFEDDALEESAPEAVLPEAALPEENAQDKDAERKP
jgi:hypothetical protein